MTGTRRPWRFGILGCGRMGRWHTEKLHADGRGRVMAVCDWPDYHAANKLCEDLAPDAHSYDDPDVLISFPDLDAVIICTPTTSHFDLVQACLQLGLHVLCEKPLAATRDEILQLCAGARSGPNLMVAYQRRFWSVYRTLRREVLSGRWGGVRAVTSVNTEAWQPTIAGTWRDDPHINVGGFVGDAGSHKIDAVFYATGLRPVAVFATSRTCGSRVEIVTSVVARLEGDVPLTMSFVGHAQAFHEALHVHCERADLRLVDGVLWIARGGRVEPVAPPEPHSEPVGGFLDLLDGTGENVAPPDCALPVYDFTQAILTSSRTGKLAELSVP